jgi:nicotinate dehydrogenase subunit B
MFLPCPTASSANGCRKTPAIQNKSARASRCATVLANYIMPKHPIARRDLLKGGALVVWFQWLDGASQALAQLGPPPGSSPYHNPDYLDPSALDSWVAIQQDGSVIVYTGKVDLGTGVETALAQIVAEELDVPFERVRMKMGDTAKTVDQGRTAGSNTLLRAGPQIRQATAAARQHLLKLASARLDAPAERLKVADGVISVADASPADSAKTISYGQLIGGKRFDLTITASGMQGDMKIAPEVPAKSYKDYKIVGHSVPRVDLPGKLTAGFTYISDMKVPGMLHGRVVRPPAVISQTLRVDEASIRNIPGVVKVVREGTFVGVVAETEWAAIQAARALRVEWAPPPFQMPATPDEVDAYLRSKPSFQDVSLANTGNVASVMASAAKTFQATYRWPFQLHGMLLPSCAIADVRGDTVTIWTGAQGPFTTRDRVASLLSVPKRNVDVRFVEGSGCYGRLTSDDASEDAVLLSRAVGKPVRVQWMRADEHGWEPKGPQQLMDVRAAVDAQGKIIAWEFLARTFPWTEAQGTPQLGERQIGQKSTAPLPGNPVGSGAAAHAYEVPNQKIVGSYVDWPQDSPTPLRTNPLRSPGEPGGVFASESFIDEIAADLGVDPVQFRLAHLQAESSRRVAEAVRTAARDANWTTRPSPAPAAGGGTVEGRGIAVSTRIGTVVAAVAEVSVEKATGKISVRRVVVAHDCGLVVNPDGLKFQVDGNVIQGVSRTLFEEVKFDATQQKNLDWRSYPVISFRDVPAIETTLINHPEMPYFGAGEAGIGPIPAAIANAVFDATGVRLRRIPFTPDRVLAALQSAQVAARRS